MAQRQQEAVWATSFGGVGFSTIALGAQSNAIYMSGNLVAPLTVPLVDGSSASLVPAGDSDVYVAKIDPASGIPVWARAFGGPGGEYAGRTMAVDETTVYVASVFSQKMEVPLASGNTTTLVAAGSTDAFVLALDVESGGVIWARSWGTPEADWGRALVAGPKGLYFIGEFGADFGVPLVDGGDAVLTCDPPGSCTRRRGVVMQLDRASGGVIWGQSLGGRVDFDSIATDSEGAVYVAGPCEYTDTNFTVPMTGGADAAGNATGSVKCEFGGTLVVMRLDSASGRASWIHTLQRGTGGFAMSADASYGLYLKIDLRVFMHESHQEGIQVWRLDPESGKEVWTTEIQQGGFDFNFVYSDESGVVGSRDGVFVTGPCPEKMTVALADGTNVTLQAVVPADAGASRFQDSRDVYLLKLDAASGQPVSAGRFGGTGADQGVGVAVSGGGDLYVCGLFQDSMDVPKVAGGGNITLTSPWNHNADSHQSAFLLKLAAAA